MQLTALFLRACLPQGLNYTLPDLCSQVSATDRRCRVSSVLSAWNFSRAALAADPDVVATLNAARDGSGRPLNLNYL